MDAEYLKLNINDALIEALTATSKSDSDDKIDYLGNYLIQYVRRNQKAIQIDGQVLKSKLAAKIEIDTEVEAQRVIDDNLKKIHDKKSALDNFLGVILQSSKIPQQSFDVACNFVSSYLEVPSVYFATRNLSEETDEISYISANDSQVNIMKGQKLIRNLADYDESIERNGVSFDAFKPLEEEEEEEESPEDEETEEQKSNKKIPKKQPTLIIDNVMRNKNCKFFSIPKLGSLVVVPLSIQSCDHEAGCTIIIEEPPEQTESEEQEQVQEETTEDNEPNTGTEKSSPQPVIKYLPVYNKIEYMLAIDTIGTYKKLSSEDISTLELIGEQIMKNLERMESLKFQKHVTYIQYCKSVTTTIQSLLSHTQGLEEKIITAIENKFNPSASEEDTPGEEEEGEEKMTKSAESTDPTTKKDDEDIAIYLHDITTEPAHDLLKSYHTQTAIYKLWTSLLTRDDIMTSYIGQLVDYQLPVPSIIIQLFQTIAIFLDILSLYQTNEGNLTWTTICQDMLPALKSYISQYDPTLSRHVIPEVNTLEVIKGLCDTYSLYDKNTYVSNNIPEDVHTCLQWLPIWLQKAIEAREIAINYYREVKETELEIVPVDSSTQEEGEGGEN